MTEIPPKPKNDQNTHETLKKKKKKKPLNLKNDQNTHKPKN